MNLEKSELKKKFGKNIIFDANDTMYVEWDYSGGSQQVDIDGDSYLSVHLVC